MAFPGSIYAPPGVYTRTLFENPVQNIAATLRIPLILGIGSEILFQPGLELVRGSSSTVDQRVVQEDEAGRAVSSISAAGAVTLGAFDGTLDRVQVKNFPIVTGDGTGTTATNAASINVTVNGTPVVVLSVDGAKGILTLSVTPEVTDEVLVTYFFNRTDTLITDDVSDQISPVAPEFYGSIGQNFVVTTGVNDTLSFTVDSEDSVSVTLSASPVAGWTAAQIAAFVNSAATGTSLQASSAADNFGNTVLYLTADRGIEIGSGTANTTLGLDSGASSSRNGVFYTFQRPIVDGTNGGVTTTDPADVTVKVDGTQVLATAVDGQTGAVTLPFAPEIGATVTIQYYFNSWQDTFDYLANRGITEITRCGITADRNDYIDGADFVLKDDKILWGTAVLVESGEHTTGSTYFNDSQVSTTLVDTRQFLAACDPVVNTSVSPPVENRVDFNLPLQPTTGNGRDTPLGASTYSAVSNGRIDLPTNRPDLVFAYWGYSVEDALDRGRVEVTKVESSTSTITLAEKVPVGANVYATFYYNTLVDQSYSVSCVTGGSSGVGTYTIFDENENNLLTPQFGSKSAGLATVTVEFPSGSERTPDLRFEAPFATTSFVGAVEEDVTVEFAAQDATLAKYAVPSSGPYYVVSGSSDHFQILVDNAALGTGSAGALAYVDLSNPTSGAGCGFFAQIVGDEIAYEADTGDTTFEIDATNNVIDLEVDGVLVQAQAAAAATATADNYVAAINQAAFGLWGETAVGGGAQLITIDPTSLPSDQDDYYNGWEVVVTAGLGVAATVLTVTDYDGATGVLAVSGAATYDGTSVFSLYDPASAPSVTGATRFLSATTITAGEYDELVLSVTGSVTGVTAISCTVGDVIAPATYTTATLLAGAVQTAVTAAIATAGAACQISVTADTSGRLVFTLIPDPTDTDGAFLEFVESGAFPDGSDFAILAGLDTATAASGAQTKLVAGPVARRFTFAGTNPLNNLQYDRIILRNRVIPGRGNLDGQFDLGQTQLLVLGGTGASQAGLTANENGYAGLRATIMEPTLFGEVGLAGGQVTALTYGDARDGQPIVTFYSGAGTKAQNNVFKATIEGTPITVEFTPVGGGAVDAAGSDVPLGPASSADTVLNQINDALTAAGLSVSAVQEGAGIRFRGSSSASSASIVIGTGSANSDLGFSDGAEAYRDVLDPEVLVSGLMADSENSVSNHILTWASGGSGTHFTNVALAKTIKDDTNAKFLFLQSLGGAGAGTTSSIAFEDATTSSVTLPGVGMGVADGDGNTGEDAIDGFFVTSSDTSDGSGTADTSLLNSGTGQDGRVGQTYRDLVTGLTFTILPRAGGASYPTGETLTFRVRSAVTTDSNLPVNTVPGVELVVANTSGIEVGDTAVVETFEKGGNQPAVGDVYYVSYLYAKQDFSSQIFTKLSAVEAAYGNATPENPVSLAAYLAIINGAVAVAIKQVQKDTDTDSDGVLDSASETAYINAVDDVEGALPGGALPDYIVPLKGDSLTLLQYVAQHCDVQSSIRYRAERTAICGFSAGTQPREAGDIAQAVARSRERLVYPDIYSLTQTTADGRSESYLVDGTYMAAAVAGSRASSNIDVATPWTGSRIFGFDEISRTLDAVQENQVAVRGVTVLSQSVRTISIRQGLTTDMTNVLTKLPTVIQIADEVQRQSRNTLDRFIGVKFLPGLTSQIEAQLSNTLKQLQSANIIATFTGVAANVAENDPTVAEVEAYYQPVFPLLYIVITFNLRASL
jgi:hypothetical protein